MKISLEKNFDKAEKMILNACDEGLKDVGRILKGKLRKVININFNKQTGSLLKGVQDKIKINSKDNKEVMIGITKDVKHALWLYKGTGIRKHHKTGKSVGKLNPTNYMDQLLRENKSQIQNIITKYFKRI